MASYETQDVDPLEELTGIPAPRVTVHDVTGDDNAAVNHEDTGSKPQKRKTPPTAGNGKQAKQQKVAENRAIYITNLPRDATLEELEAEFTKRGGIIDRGTNGEARIKMYADEKGEFNGEALVVYFKKESIEQAIRFWDGMTFRAGDTEHGELHVEEAGRFYKKNTDKETIVKKMDRKDRKAAERTRAELNRKLAEWSDNEEEVEKTYAPKVNKWAHNAIVWNAFRPFELQDDPDAYNEIMEDMMEAAEDVGPITKCVIYDKEPAGVIVIRFTEIDNAKKFMLQVNGRGYNERKLEVTIAEDRPKFRKSTDDAEDEYAKLLKQRQDMEDSD